MTIGLNLRTAGAALMADLLMAFPTQAQDFALLPPEKVTTFLGIDLPLQPGERLVPTADGDCSVVVFAPTPDRYERHRAYWEAHNWLGACRFGLAHGPGYASRKTDEATRGYTMLYGISIATPLESETRNWPSGGTYIMQTEAYYSSPALHDLSEARYYIIHGQYSDLPTKDFKKFETSWSDVGTFQKISYDGQGNEFLVTIQSMNVADQCETHRGAKNLYSTEVRKACKAKSAGKYILVRREGYRTSPTASHQIITVKACPYKTKGDYYQDCGLVLRDVLGTEAAQVESAVSTDNAHRAAAAQAVLARYAPLEQALENRIRRSGNIAP
ncbi:hypothetical protein [Gimibacter soli]|uniref:Uncharacterized protein n=1 Tax=Gimibacter soli TaxID=3024400 RepID=A0AAF0BJQ4_9PROT|nr:hypothetical protein [Gimibacter soli]WCL53369.1 hypothetical protein PH603_12555 [Gimibacter soli]